MMKKSKEERKTAFVVVFSAVVMVIEIVAGWLTQSMALLADGIHMGSHVLAIGLSWAAYVFIRRLNERQAAQISKDRVLSLAAYTSGVLLLLVAVAVMVEAVGRLWEPVAQIRYVEAMTVAVVGMVVNLICAAVLHAKKGEGDENSHSAYLHVIADALTSIGAIFGLLCAAWWGITWIDAAVAALCSLVILRWACGLLWQTSRSLVNRDAAPL